MRWRPHDAVAAAHGAGAGLIKNFLKDVQWGDLDYLIIDSTLSCVL